MSKRLTDDTVELLNHFLIGEPYVELNTEVGGSLPGF